jgi:hypothetical protein
MKEWFRNLFSAVGTVLEGMLSVCGAPVKAK